MTAALVLGTACSGGDDDAVDTGVAPVVTGPPSTGPDGAPPTSSSAAGAPPTAAGETGAATSELVTVPEVGVPGLDSDDVLCRSWSRFGGSFQVLAVAASFGEGGPSAVAELEVLAAPSVTAAYETLLANWPDELAAERDVVADDYLGPFARRSQLAFDALVAAGADDATLDEIAAAWDEALAARDPTNPAFSVAVPAGATDVVDAAAAEFVEQVVPIPGDPALVVTAQAPATEAYLATTCPDRGTLGGIEVDPSDAPEGTSPDASGDVSD